MDSWQGEEGGRFRKLLAKYVANSRDLLPTTFTHRRLLCCLLLPSASSSPSPALPSPLLSSFSFSLSPLSSFSALLIDSAMTHPPSLRLADVIRLFLPSLPSSSSSSSPSLCLVVLASLSSCSSLSAPPGPTERISSRRERKAGLWTECTNSYIDVGSTHRAKRGFLKGFS